MPIRHVNEILTVIIPDLFEKSKSQKRADSEQTREREWPKICAILEMDRERAA